MPIPDMTATFARRAGLAILSACCLILIFPFFDIEMLAWIAFIPLFMAIQQQDVKNTFWLGWITGVAYCLGTLYWVTITMVLYGGLPPWLSVMTLPHSGCLSGTVRGSVYRAAPIFTALHCHSTDRRSSGALGRTRISAVVFCDWIPLE